jgi:periplasmic divalent cation tolerance protein
MTTPDTDAIVILTNTASRQEAKTIASELISHKLAACVNIFKNEASIYEWEGKICEEQEFQLVIKTRQSLYPQNEALIKKLHSYDAPEIIAIPIKNGNSDYLDWIKTVTI